LSKQAKIDILEEVKRRKEEAALAKQEKQRLLKEKVV
jgi:hypothetical protein